MQIRLQIPKEKSHNISPWILTFTQRKRSKEKLYGKEREEGNDIVILIFTSLDDSTTLMKREGWFLLEVTNVSTRACFHILLHLYQEVK